MVPLCARAAGVSARPPFFLLLCWRRCRLSFAATRTSTRTRMSCISWQCPARLGWNDVQPPSDPRQTQDRRSQATTAPVNPCHCRQNGDMQSRRRERPCDRTFQLNTLGLGCLRLFYRCGGTCMVQGTSENMRRSSGVYFDYGKRRPAPKAVTWKASAAPTRRKGGRSTAPPRGHVRHGSRPKTACQKLWYSFLWISPSHSPSCSSASDARQSASPHPAS